MFEYLVYCDGKRVECGSLEGAKKIASRLLKRTKPAQKRMAVIHDLQGNMVCAMSISEVVIAIHSFDQASTTTEYDRSVETPGQIWE